MRHVKLLLPVILLLLPTIGLTSDNSVSFPKNYSEDVLYTTVHRGIIKEDIYTSHAAIKAVKNGKPIPGGTVITLVDYRDGNLKSRCHLAMEFGTSALSPLGVHGSSQE